MENNYELYVMMYDRNAASFRRAGVTPSEICNLGGYKITITKTIKKGRRVISQETETATPYNYACLISWVNAFHDRIEHAYTFAGYLPVRFAHTDPYTGERHIAEVKIENS